MRVIVMLVSLLSFHFVMAVGLRTGSLESVLWRRVLPQDDLVNEDESVQRYGRDIDALPDFAMYLRDQNMTTNVLVSSIVNCARTNALLRASMLNKQLEYAAIKTLSEINHPASVSFLKEYCQAESAPCYYEALVGIFRYSNLGQETVAYLKERCGDTNVYDQVALEVLWEMEKSLRTVPACLEGPARTNLAEFAYYSLEHTHADLVDQEEVLTSVFPVYTNSVQRLQLMGRIATRTTNDYVRAFATNIVTRLTAIPPEQRVDLPWLEGM